MTRQEETQGWGRRSLQGVPEAAPFPTSLCSLVLRGGIWLLWAPGEDDWSPPHPEGALAALLRAQACRV